MLFLSCHCENRETDNISVWGTEAVLTRAYARAHTNTHTVSLFRYDFSPVSSTKMPKNSSLLSVLFCRICKSWRQTTRPQLREWHGYSCVFCRLFISESYGTMTAFKLYVSFIVVLWSTNDIAQIPEKWVHLFNFFFWERKDIKLGANKGGFRYYFSVGGCLPWYSFSVVYEFNFEVTRHHGNNVC